MDQRESRIAETHKTSHNFVMKFNSLTLLAVIIAASSSPSAIYWSDGDSGRFNGQRLRLANVDAPETGSMKQSGGAKCEQERAMGFEAKAYIVTLTRDADIEITHSYGTDRYDRLVVDLSADGIDVGASGIAAGYLRAWPHENGRALVAKPDWCD